MVEDQIQVSCERPNIEGTIQLSGSKSISNRVLIIRALAEDNFDVSGLAASKDTQTLLQLLNSDSNLLDTGAAGTTFRFLTAYLATKGFDGVLTGSARMKQRPIGDLVNALNSLGANISYMENVGYPPLIFKSSSRLDQTNRIELPAHISSQFISALLMIAPTLPDGLTIDLIGNIVSRPYLMMTLSLMEHFGVYHSWQGQTIQIHPQSYQSRDFMVEADWSAASYYYSFAAIAESCNLRLKGLFKKSLQGDQAIMKIMQPLGVESQFIGDDLIITKNSNSHHKIVYNFIECPDLAQTVIAACAGTGTQGQFTGLETLFIKETDRVHAMQNELAKIAVIFKHIQDNVYEVNGEPQFDDMPVFQTYEDHRMAMALAPLALLHPIKIQDPNVVDKSYPDYWKDLSKIGINISED